MKACEAPATQKFGALGLRTHGLIQQGWQEAHPASGQQGAGHPEGTTIPLLTVPSLIFLLSLHLPA